MKIKNSLCMQSQLVWVSICLAIYTVVIQTNITTTKFQRMIINLKPVTESERKRKKFNTLVVSSHRSRKRRQALNCGWCWWLAHRLHCIPLLFAMCVWVNHNQATVGSVWLSYQISFFFSSILPTIKFR